LGAKRIQIIIREMLLMKGDELAHEARGWTSFHGEETAQARPNHQTLLIWLFTASKDSVAYGVHVYPQLSRCIARAAAAPCGYSTTGCGANGG
jgi:hypothetical protein